jgi:hypothetical protein
MGTGSRSLRSVPVPISPVLSRGVGKGGQDSPILPLGRTDRFV